MENNLYFEKAQKLQSTLLGTIAGGQDGAISGNCVFRLDDLGNCWVHDLQTLQQLDHFVLDKIQLLKPHSNAVFFGAERWEETDELPVLYTNIYNNYSGEQDKKEGMCCVYRILRENNRFSSQLVQVIRIGFVNDGAIWRSENKEDMRPYGNFVADAAAGKLHAFVMRDQIHKTRFFRFALPKITDGVWDAELGVNVVTLQKEDIEQQFDSTYTQIMQGASCYDGYIYSVEGFDPNTSWGIPALRVFDTNAQKEVFAVELAQYGLTKEPEFIQVYDNRLYYSDCDGLFCSFRFAD